MHTLLPWRIKKYCKIYNIYRFKHFSRRKNQRYTTSCDMDIRETLVFHDVNTRSKYLCIMSDEKFYSREIVSFYRLY